MKESKFIELLNLYIDQEISADDAALLEQEIAHNPERRKVYTQYCRMHRASSLLAESFKSGAVPSGSKLAQAAKKADDKVVLFPSQAPVRSKRWAYVGGLVAAAACVAFVLVRNGSVDPQNGATSVALKVPNMAKPMVPTEPELQIASNDSAKQVAKSSEYRPVFIPAGLKEASEMHASKALANQVNFDWMDNLNIEPLKTIPAEELLFESKSLQQDARSFRSQRPMKAKVEMTAFQFER